MISLHHLTHSFPKENSEDAVLDNITVDLPTNRRLGILGTENAGKTTLIKLLAGLDRPRSGTICRYAHLSFPIGYEGVFKQRLSLRDNLIQFSHVYGAQIDEIAAFVSAVTDMGSSFGIPLSKLPPELQHRFVFAAGYALPFDCYLVDERFAPPEREFRQKFIKMLQERAAHAGVILTTRRASIVQRFCDVAGVLANGGLTLYDNVGSAVEAFEGAEAQNASAKLTRTA